MPRESTGQNVVDEAIDRMAGVYREGHRVVVSFSGGKDSTCALEVCILAATETGRLPVDVVMRDEEIMLPGVFEYCERVYEREDVAFRWISPRQPIINIFNRAAPYYWAFDPLLDPEAWVRQPPPYIEWIEAKHIGGMVTPAMFPPAEGTHIYTVTGLRGDESIRRMYAIFSSGGFMTKPNQFGNRLLRPIYDWTDGDVWKFIRDGHLDYAHCYDTLHKMGMSRTMLRVAPPLMTAAGAKQLQVAAKAWPRWFDRVADRCPGARLGAQFGSRVLKPRRRIGETWQQTFERECLGPDTPEWIRDRSRLVMERQVRLHGKHSTLPIPDAEDCKICGPARQASWKSMARDCYRGDPFGMRIGLPSVEPEFFREGAGLWGGAPTWT